MRRRMILMLFAGLLVAGTNAGCALQKYLMTNNRVDDTEKTDDEWAYVRKEARGDRPMEENPNARLDDFMHSKKYRDIERSLGYK